MSYGDERSNEIDREINRLNNVKKALRMRERDLDARRRYLQSQPVPNGASIKTLRNGLLAALPNYMMPGNVGGLTQVTWPFLFNINIDIGTNPTVINQILARGSFQVDQESALLLQAVSIAFNTDAAGASACVNAPLQVEIIDRQSSRRFNSAPIPIQMLGQNSQPSILPTSMYEMPNAFIDIEVSGIPTVGQVFNGSGSMQFQFFGQRIRTDDAGAVLSTIFQE